MARFSSRAWASRSARSTSPSRLSCSTSSTSVRRSISPCSTSCSRRATRWSSKDLVSCTISSSKDFVNCLTSVLLWDVPFVATAVMSCSIKWSFSVMKVCNRVTSASMTCLWAPAIRFSSSSACTVRTSFPSRATWSRMTSSADAASSRRSSCLLDSAIPARFLASATSSVRLSTSCSLSSIIAAGGGANGGVCDIDSILLTDFCSCSTLRRCSSCKMCLSFASARTWRWKAFASASAVAEDWPPSASCCSATSLWTRTSSDSRRATIWPLSSTMD
mmetsp:Transcript_85130/g.264487  ORF Transcript_85130/g.264487 Transcript_85130/m.264487 type:complete len:276 (-) Transcript_85130:588-1415(-)